VHCMREIVDPAELKGPLFAIGNHQNTGLP